MIFWNLIHGCHQKSEGCAHCFVFARDEENGIDTNVVRKTASFYSPQERNRKGDWKIPSGSMLQLKLISTCPATRQIDFLGVSPFNRHPSFVGVVYRIYSNARLRASNL